MKTRTTSNLITLVAAFLSLPVISAGAAAAHHRVRKGAVVVFCPMTVGGSFEARTASISGSVGFPGVPGALDGSFQVDLKTLDTGIDLRNRHLRDNYLEIGKGAGFDTATLSGIVLDAKDPGAFTGKTTFRGTFELHGQKKDVTGEAQVRKQGEVYLVDAAFPLLVADFQIKKPSYLGVGVKNELKVRVSLEVAPVAEAAAK